MGQIADWAGLTGDEFDRHSTRGSFYLLTGFADDVSIRNLGVLPPDDYNTAIGGWRIPEGTGDRAPTLNEWGIARTMHHVASIWAGKQLSTAQWQEERQATLIKSTAEASAAMAAASQRRSSRPSASS